MLAETKHNFDEMKAQLSINKKMLDIALQQQPQLFSDVADSYAEAASFRDQAKEALNQLDAHIANDFRKSCIDKVTEARVLEHVEMHEEHRQQTEMYLAYKLRAEQWLGLVKAFEQRVQMIRDLCSLEKQGYFGSGLVKDSEYTEALAASAAARRTRDAV